MQLGFGFLQVDLVIRKKFKPKIKNNFLQKMIVIFLNEKVSFYETNYVVLINCLLWVRF